MLAKQPRGDSRADASRAAGFGAVGSRAAGGPLRASRASARVRGSGASERWQGVAEAFEAVWQSARKCSAVSLKALGSQLEGAWQSARKSFGMQPRSTAKSRFASILEPLRSLELRAVGPRIDSLSKCMILMHLS